MLYLLQVRENKENDGSISHTKHYLGIVSRVIYLGGRVTVPVALLSSSKRRLNVVLRFPIPMLKRRDFVFLLAYLVVYVS